MRRLILATALRSPRLRPATRRRIVAALIVGLP